MLNTLKGGANPAEITVTEVGSIKSEIAYLGNTIITAARIWEKIHEIDLRHFISEALHQQLNGSE